MGWCLTRKHNNMSCSSLEKGFGKEKDRLTSWCSRRGAGRERPGPAGWSASSRPATERERPSVSSNRPILATVQHHNNATNCSGYWIYHRSMWSSGLPCVRVPPGWRLSRGCCRWVYRAARSILYSRSVTEAPLRSPPPADTRYHQTEALISEQTRSAFSRRINWTTDLIQNHWRRLKAAWWRYKAKHISGSDPDGLMNDLMGERRLANPTLWGLRFLVWGSGGQKPHWSDWSPQLTSQR